MVTLGPGHATALITVTNEGDEPARFETSLNAWGESRDGQTSLEPSADVVVFPQLITLPPHEAKKIRIGTELAPGAAERSYRSILQELPQFNRGTGQVNIQVLSKISLPIFFAPQGAAAKPALDAVALSDGVLSFDVANTGGAHFMLRQVEVTGHSAGGEAFSLKSNGWYVLPGGRRAYRVVLAAEDCKRSGEIVIRATSDNAPVEAHLKPGAGACGTDKASRFVKIDSAAAPPL
jgi:fimbrial chaperone protein